MLDELRRKSGAPAVLPAKATCTGIEFIEFTADQRAKGALEQTLTGLGFTRPGCIAPRR